MRRCTYAIAITGLIACGHASPIPEGQAPVDPVDGVPPQELFDRGVAMARSGDLVRAEQYLATSMARGQPPEQVLPILLRVCISSSRLRMALGYAEPYLQSHPDAWSLRYLLASIHLGMGDPLKAQIELEEVLRGAPDEPAPHYLLAVVLRDEVGDLPAAEVHFRRYIELAPTGNHAREVAHSLERGRPPIRTAPRASELRPDAPQEGNEP